MFAPFEFRHCGQGVRIFKPCVILRPEVVSLGDHARVDAFTKIEGGLGVVIGERVHVGSGSRLNVGGGELLFGAHSGCSVNVVIATGQPDLSYRLISAAEEPEDCHVIRSRTVVGELVVIFAGAIITPGVTIGDGAIVAAGAVVTCDIPAFEVWGGVPARFIKRREVAH